MKEFRFIQITKQNRGLKILVLSDLHVINHGDISRMTKMMQKFDEKHYDAAYLVGDIIDSTNVLRTNPKVTGKLLEFISFLGNKMPTYIVYGSHDVAFFTPDRHSRQVSSWIDDEGIFREKFLDIVSKYHGIHVLENETQEMIEGYTISGINPSLKYAIGVPDGDPNQLEAEAKQYSFLKNLDCNQTNILLCHYPNAIFQLHRTGLLENVNLSISGHNHNGMTQLKVFPLEGILNIFGQANRGIITPGKSIKLSDTAKMRGINQLGDDQLLFINPAAKSLAETAGILKYGNCLFYSGYSEIEYVKEKTLCKK